MDARMIIPIEQAYQHEVNLIGAKAKNLSICLQHGFSVPDGFCIDTNGYRMFIRNNKLNIAIDMEVMRKSDKNVRWEELWDASLRIRSMFLRAPMPEQLESQIKTMVGQWPKETVWAVRSSAPDEDSGSHSFAGIYESYVHVRGVQDVLDKVKLVWASLWSDRSLLYKEEQALDSRVSTMSVLVQKMEKRPWSGLTFTADPSSGDRSSMVVETVSGTLDHLVDNKKEPIRYRVDKNTGKMEPQNPKPGKDAVGIKALQQLVPKWQRLETIFDRPVDIEWTGIGKDFTVLQVRPITTVVEDANEERKWYMTLTPKGQTLVELAHKVEKEYIPQLKKEGDAFETQTWDVLDQTQTVEALRQIGTRYDYWTQVYKDSFIPFAHGVRFFGTFYNDLLKPQDPYRFIELLRGQSLLANQRNAALSDLARQLKKNDELVKKLNGWIREGIKGEALQAAFVDMQTGSDEHARFADRFIQFLHQHVNISYEGVSLNRAPEIFLSIILKEVPETKTSQQWQIDGQYEDLIKNYLERAEQAGVLEEAKRCLAIGRVSWKLRDDDNILMARLENALLLGCKSALRLLYQKGRIDYVVKQVDVSKWRAIADALQEGRSLSLHEIEKKKQTGEPSDMVLRQLIGQPSSSGIVTAPARVIRSTSDFADVQKGEILVFDAVSPQMTFIISLAGGIVERRGGMLVHSSIIARELKIPAVNGVHRATEWIKTGEVITVNGDLGLVARQRSAL